MSKILWINSSGAGWAHHVKEMLPWDISVA